MSQDILRNSPQFSGSNCPSVYKTCTHGLYIEPYPIHMIEKAIKSKEIAVNPTKDKY